MPKDLNPGQEHFTTPEVLLPHFTVWKLELLSLITRNADSLDAPV